jgi:hypothetical protein
VVGFLSLLSGCAAIIGVPDLTLEETPAQEKLDGSSVDGSSSMGDGSTTDGSTAQADGSPNVGCNADLKTDKRHCGACGHDCTNGTCKDGLCTLTSDLEAPEAIALTDDTVYIGLSGDRDLQGVLRCPKTGCASPTVGAEHVSPADAGYLEVLGLVTWQQHVFATDYYGYNSGKVWRMELDGGGFTQVPPSSAPQQRSYGVAIDPTHLYWVESYEPGAIYDCELPDCATAHPIRTQLTTPELIAVAPDKRLVYTDNGGHELWTCPSKDDCASPQKVSTSYYINGVVIDGGTVYWAAWSTVYSCSLSPVCANPTTVVDEPGSVVTALAVSSGRIWYSSVLVNDAEVAIDDEGSIKTCTIDGCTGAGARVIATKQKAPQALILDDKSVYWANAGKRHNTGGIGTVVKAPR